jgi:HTH-type transcriptional regulator / antitoxin HigA
MRTYPFNPDYRVPPGETLKEYMETVGDTQTDMARKLYTSRAFVRRLLAGEERITEELAAQLDHHTAIPARLWLRLEELYREEVK